jgi:chromosome partitioning protein
MTKIISFANRKGGCGKSTLLMLTATALRRRTKYKILVIDADPQTSIMSQREADTLEEHDSRYVFDLTAFNFSKQSEGDIPLLRFTKLIEKANNDFDLIFIDAPGTMEGEVIPVILTLSDYIVIPIVASILDINSTLSFLSLVDSVNKQREDDLQVLGIVNKKDRTYEYSQLSGLEGKSNLHLLKSSLSNRVEYRRISTIKELINKTKEHEFNDYINELSKKLKL